MLPGRARHRPAHRRRSPTPTRYVGVGAFALLAVVVLHLPVPAARPSSGPRARRRSSRSATSSSPRCRSACIADDAQDARAARPHDRAPLRGGRPLLARDGQGARLPARRAGAHPHRRRCSTTSASSSSPTRSCSPTAASPTRSTRSSSATPGRARSSIAEIDGYGPVAEIVRPHHERIDGSGYPTASPATTSRSGRGSSPSPTSTT